MEHLRANHNPIFPADEALQWRWDKAWGGPERKYGPKHKINMFKIHIHFSDSRTCHTPTLITLIKPDFIYLWGLVNVLLSLQAQFYKCIMNGMFFTVIFF